MGVKWLYKLYTFKRMNVEGSLVNYVLMVLTVMTSDDCYDSYKLRNAKAGLEPNMVVLFVFVTRYTRNLFHHPGSTHSMIAGCLGTETCQ